MVPVLKIKLAQQNLSLNKTHSNHRIQVLQLKGFVVTSCRTLREYCDTIEHATHHTKNKRPPLHSFDSTTLHLTGLHCNTMSADG